MCIISTGKLKTCLSAVTFPHF